MKKIILLFFCFVSSIATTNAQKGINFSRKYAAGGKLLMCVDSLAKNVQYANVFPNQPRTFFNYLPDVNNVDIQINFRNTDHVPDYRYTILVNNKPIAVNKAFDIAQLKNTNAGGDDEIFRSTSLGTFSVKDKIITTLVYSIESPLEIDKCVFYGKPIPKAKIKAFSKLGKADKGYDYKWVTNPKAKTRFTFDENDLELTIVKDKSDVDYLYYTSIKDKLTNKIIFKSTAWEYGGLVEEHQLLPYVKVDKNVFKKSGDYEIIIQPLIKWDDTTKNIEKYITRHTLSITLEEEAYTKKELFMYSFIVAFILGFVFVLVFYFVKIRNKKKLAEKEQQKNMAKLQLNAIRSQLNPHFMFNALAGIQNLMNKNQIDSANNYLSKFARLTRNVLDDKELISLSQEEKLLDDYLQMELLRFGFTYEINHSENLDLTNIEIPSMLLQPFVENAVKHGIAQKANEGKISITFVNEANNLVLTVADNGDGFDAQKQNSGLGIALSENRIKLLNSIYKENRFILAIQSTTKGTKISLTLTDWL